MFIESVKSMSGVDNNSEAFFGRETLVQCDQKKSPNVYKSCPKTISLEKWLILTPLQKLTQKLGDLGKFIVVTKGFKNLPKVQ